MLSFEDRERAKREEERLKLKAEVSARFDHMQKLYVDVTQGVPNWAAIDRELADNRHFSKRFPEADEMYPAFKRARMALGERLNLHLLKAHPKTNPMIG